jgi:hypothetical protein
VKVATTVQHEPPASPFRSNLNSVIEAYLKGAKPCDRMLLVRRGLLSFLLDQILNPPGEWFCCVVFLLAVVVVYLKGAKPCDRMLLVRRGLLSFLLDQILNPPGKGFLLCVVVVV